LLGRVLPETIRLELTYQPNSYWVHADPTRLQQVFMNLALNARDAMPDGGVLRFALNRLRISSEGEAPFPSMALGEWIQVAVTDTGQGISAEVRQHIFEPFYTTKPAGQGTGLGLAQVYGIVKQHGGYIDVHSQAGEGTTFIIYLPALPTPKPEPLPVETLPVFDGKGKTVLVVEDDDASREAIAALLSAQNYRVLSASDGRQALELFEQNSKTIALVISDVVMPEMGGLALHQELSRRNPELKMLFITGHPMVEENQRLLEKGAVHWLQKPFSVKEFNQAIEELNA
jgi:CheY-like chemotaxis protein